MGLEGQGKRFINKYKAHHGENLYLEKMEYEEISAPVVRFILICLLLPIVVHLDLKSFLMDIKISFLWGELGKEIKKPISFKVEGNKYKERY